MLSVPLPPFGMNIEITQLPQSWLRLADEEAWRSAGQKLLERIGRVCQNHIKAIMDGREANKDGNIVPFLNPTGKARDAVQFNVEDRHVDIFIEERASYLTYVEYGVSTHPMTYLIGKTVPFILKRGSRISPRSGKVVEGVTRVRYAGPGSPYAAIAGGKIVQTKRVAKDAIDGVVRYSAITSTTFSEPSKFNATGLRWWNPGYAGRHPFRDGVIAGLQEASDRVKGLSFVVAAPAWEPDFQDYNQNEASDYSNE